MANNINIIKEDNGSLSYADDVVATIAGKAAVEIDGVNKMCSNLSTGIAELFGKKMPNRGVKVESDNEKATLDLFLIVEYGAQVPSVADRVQANVKKSSGDHDRSGCDSSQRACSGRICKGRKSS